MMSESGAGCGIDVTTGRSLSWRNSDRTHDDPSGSLPMTHRPAAGYPLHRMRRLRGHPGLRELVRESSLTVADLIYPMFVYHGENVRREIGSMPGQYQLSLDRFGEAVAEVAGLGIPA